MRTARGSKPDTLRHSLFKKDSQKNKFSHKKLDNSFYLLLLFLPILEPVENFLYSVFSVFFCSKASIQSVQSVLLYIFFLNFHVTLKNLIGALSRQTTGLQNTWYLEIYMTSRLYKKIYEFS